MFRRIPLFELDDVSDDPWTKWGYGVVVPCLLSLFGASRMVYQQATLIGYRGRGMSLTGGDAVAFGVAILAGALFMHVRYFWSNSTRLAGYVDLGTVVAILVGIVSLGIVLVRNALPF